MLRFFELCKKPIIDIDSASPIKMSDNIARRIYRKQAEGNMNFQIDALILPEDMIWPTFLSPSKHGASFKNIYYQRQTVVDVNRRTMSIDSLRKNGQIVWTGLPGIGKASDLNHIILELLKHLGEETWPRNVAFRAENSLITFTSSNVTCSEFSFSDLLKYSKRHQKDHSVLILELQESETDPQIVMPFILALSNTDLTTTLKTYMKSRYGDVMLVSPPDVEELCLMTEAIMDVCPDNDIFPGASKESAVQIVRNRASEIGAVPRYVICSESIFAIRREDMKCMTSKELSHDLRKLSPTNLPPAAQYFLAPFFRHGVTNPTFCMRYSNAAPDYIASLPQEIRNTMNLQSLSNYEYRYLSDIAKLLRASKLVEVEDIATIRVSEFRYQLAEALIRYGGILRLQYLQKIDDDFKSVNWEWHKNVSYKNVLSSSTLLPERDIPNLPRCSSEINFDGTYYDGSVGDLNPDRLYRGLCHTLAFYEYFTIDHTEKMIYFYQVTQKDLKYHPFSVTTIRTVMTKLRMFEEKNLEYKATLLCICDWSREVTHGTKFYDANNKDCSLEELKSNGDEIAGRLKVYIIRACLFPSTKKHEFEQNQLTN